MAFINKFCFTCSVRLGSVIIAITTLIQTSVLLGLSIYCMDSLATVTELLHTFSTSFNIESNFLKELAKNPQPLITFASTFFSCLICSCILLLYGSFQCKALWMYPFVFFYLLYIFGLFLALLTLIFFMKSKRNGLGDLILYSNLGGFILLFYLYTWLCVVSLIQIINELKHRLTQKLKVVESTKLFTKMEAYNKNKTKGIHNYAYFN